MERRLYIDCAKSVVRKLHEELNGRVIFEVYPEVDTIIFKIMFKDFEFSCAVNNIQEVIYTDQIDAEVKMILEKYKKAVLSAFFKTDSRKARDNRRKLNAIQSQ